MRFAVTGGAGFIGSHLTHHLVKQGHDVVVIDNKFRGRLENLSGVLDRIEFHTLDILDTKALNSALKDADGIFHQAALTSVSESYTKEDKYKLVNVTGTENIFKIAKEFNQKVVYASSSSVYGNTEKLPIKEDTTRNPINPYGLTKLEDEILAQKYSQSGSEIIGLRYFNVFGKGQTLDYAGVITKFLERIQSANPPIVFGDGSQSRDFIFVKDVARANLAAMQGNVSDGFFNIGTGNLTTIKQLAKKMIFLSGKNLELSFDKLPDGDVRSSQADVSLSHDLLHWRSETSLESGLSTFFT